MALKKKKSGVKKSKKSTVRKKKKPKLEGAAKSVDCEARGLGAKRIARRKQIRVKLEKKLVDSERKKKHALESELHGITRVSKIDTLSGEHELNEVKPEFLVESNKPIADFDFFIYFQPGELKRIEESRKNGAGKNSRAVRKLVLKQNNIFLNEAKLIAVEEQLRELLDAFMVSFDELQGGRIFQPLSLTELDKRVTKEVYYKPISVDRGLPNFEIPRTRAIDLAEHVALHRLFFDSAAVFALASIEENSSPEKLALELGLSIKRTQECIEFLKKQGLIESGKRKKSNR